MDAFKPVQSADRFIGGYELLEQIGKGGMGTVHKARSRAGQIVALKLLSPELTENPVQLKRFYQEAETAQRINHPNIVRAMEVGEEHGRHYLAMELIDGESVAQRLKRVKRIPERDAVHIIVAIARAVHAAHQIGLIHRDIKPDNILLDRSGAVKLTDLGLVKQVDAELNLTQTGRGLGTPHYMAPEQFRDAKNANSKCDVYSLGATLYVMVTGELPFKGIGPLEAFLRKSKNQFTAPEDIEPTLSARTAMIVKSAMHADPNRRPADAAAFADALLGIETEEPADDVWFVIFYDHIGLRKKAKGSTASIIRHLQACQIPTSAKVSRDKKGPYTLIGSIPEFAAEASTEAFVPVVSMTDVAEIASADGSIMLNTMPNTGANTVDDDVEAARATGRKSDWYFWIWLALFVSLAGLVSLIYSMFFDA